MKTVLPILMIVLSTCCFAAVPVSDGLIIHLQADTLALNDSEPVTTWADSATSDTVNGTVNQYTGYGAPSFAANAINGLPAVRFTRPADVLMAPNTEKQVLVSSQWSWAAAQGVTVFIVCTGGTIQDVQRVVQIGKTGGTVNKCLGCDVNSDQSITDDNGSGVRYNNGWAVTARAGTNPVKQGNWHVSMRQLGQSAAYGGIRYTVNSDPVAVENNVAVTSPKTMAFDGSGNDISIGNGWQNNGWVWSDWYDGYVAEVIVYNKQLNPVQVKQVNDYLNNKYDLYDPIPGGKFTIAAIPDSQGYADNDTQPESINIFIGETQYIVDSISKWNTVFASHEGDLMTVSNDTRYSRACQGLDRLHNNLPFGLAPGNHDYDDTSPDCNGSILWNKYVGPTTKYFSGKSWYGGYASNGTDTDGMTSWQTFNALGVNFLHISFELMPSDSRLNWMQSVINSHAGWPTIMTTHQWINTAADWAGASNRSEHPNNSATQVWNEFIRVNPQIFLVLCGHYYGTSRRSDDNNSGYPVHQILADYQGSYSGPSLGNGGGWIRLLEFDTATNTIAVRTYSSLLDKYSNDPTLTDGSSYAMQWAEWNYDGGGNLYAESNMHSSKFTLPFIYGKQLPYPAKAYGQHISGLTKSFNIAGTGDWAAGGLAFDPSYKVNNNYDRVYYINRTATGTQGLYRASISAGNSSGLLVLGSLTDPAGCALDAEGSAYVCYNIAASIWKVQNPSGATTQMLGNYRAAGDDDIASIMMVPKGFGGGFDEGSDLVIIDSGIDADTNEGIVAVESTSTAANPQYSVLWEDTIDYYTSDLRGCASDYDGFVYIVPMTIPFGSVSGTTMPYINRLKPGLAEVIYLDTDITRGGAAPVIDDSVTVNPANGSIWLATTYSTSGGDTYGRTVWRIDVKNAAVMSPGIYMAHVTAEITNLYINIGNNGMAWSPDGKYLAMACADTDKMYIFQAPVPVDCGDAIDKGYGLAYDFNDDCKVNLVDFASIGIDDLAQFAIQWLECIDPQTCTWIWP